MLCRLRRGAFSVSAPGGRGEAQQTFLLSTGLAVRCYVVHKLCTDRLHCSQATKEANAIVSGRPARTQCSLGRVGCEEVTPNANSPGNGCFPRETVTVPLTVTKQDKKKARKKQRNKQTKLPDARKRMRCVCVSKSLNRCTYGTFTNVPAKWTT